MFRGTAAKKPLSKSLSGRPTGGKTFERNKRAKKTPEYPLAEHRGKKGRTKTRQPVRRLRTFKVKNGSFKDAKTGRRKRKLKVSSVLKRLRQRTEEEDIGRRRPMKEEPKLRWRDDAMSVDKTNLIRGVTTGKSPC